MNRLIIALDNLTPELLVMKIREVLENNSDFRDQIVFKIHDLVSLIGFQGLHDVLKDIDCKLMLDPKWHDIPNTLKNYLKQLHASGLWSKVEYITIHTSWWTDMLTMALETKDELLPHVKLLWITALTSLDDEDTWYIFDATAQHSVLKLAKIALDLGIEWLVCSTHESNILRWVFGEHFEIVTPWVRFAWESAWDQKRVMTPSDAIINGSTHIVMWRSILWSNNISQSVNQFFSEIHNQKYINTHWFRYEKMLYTGDWKDVLSYIWAFYFRPEGWKYVRFTSKVLSNAYINIGAIERSYWVVDRACSELASQIRAKNIIADVVVGAQMWSVRISLFLAKKLGIQQSIYTEKTENNNNNMALKRHSIDLTWKRVIISEDIVSRGTTTAKMRQVLEELWATVVAIACVWNRYEQSSQDWVPIISCFVPPKFELYWDDNTPADQRKDFPRLPQWAVVSEKPKNDWWELVESMR